MTNWQISWPEWSRITGLDLALEPLDMMVNWYWDCATYTFLNLWYMPHRIPGLYSDADKWVSQFTLNGIKSTSICRPS